MCVKTYRYTRGYRYYRSKKENEQDAVNCKK